MRQRFNRLLAQLDPDSQLNLMQVTEVVSCDSHAAIGENRAAVNLSRSPATAFPCRRSPRVALARVPWRDGALPSWAIYSGQPAAMSGLSDVFAARRAHVGNSLSNCSVSRFVYHARVAMKRSLDWWQNMPAGSSISVCGRHCNGSTSTIFGIYPRWIHPMHPLTLKKSSTSVRTIQLDDGRLRIEDIVDIAEGSARVALVRCCMNSVPALREGRTSSTVCCAKRARFMASPPATAIHAPWRSRLSWSPSCRASFYAYHGCGLGEYLSPRTDAGRDRHPPHIVVQRTLRRQSSNCCINS